MRRALWVHGLLLFILLFGIWTLGVYARQGSRPLTKDEIVYLLQNYVPPGRVAEQASKKGIDFEVTSSVEQELRRDGADDGLIAALKKLAPKIAPGVSAAKSGSAPSRLAPGTVRINRRDGQRYVWIPPGRFTMGCSPGDSECAADEKPAHRVTLTKGFWLGQSSVTVDAWKRYRFAMRTAPLPTQSHNEKNLNEAGPGNMPAVMMTWDEANSFCQWAGMRLPKEAEWEYAARAGTTSSRYGDLDSIAWYADNSGRQRINSTALWSKDYKSYPKKLQENGNFVHGVALKKPNAWNLFDILGNVQQWTADRYDASYYARSEMENPTGAVSGDLHVLRGGSWFNTPGSVRVSTRLQGEPESRSSLVGLRCAGELQ